MGFPFFPMMPMGLRLAALRAAGAPLLNVLEDEDSFIEVVRIISKLNLNVSSSSKKKNRTKKKNLINNNNKQTYKNIIY